MTRALVCIATYNELATLPNLVQQILAQQPHVGDIALEILVVDDNSPDGTGTWCDDFAAQDDRLQVIHRRGKLGLGSAMIEALQVATEQKALMGSAGGYEYAITMDADLSHSPRALPAILHAAQDADVVIGSRYVKNGAIRNWPLRRRVLSLGANFAARSLLGLTAHDCSSGYRAYWVGALRAIELSQLKASGYLFYEEILAHLQWAGCRITEVPITFVDREFGQSKIGPTEILRSAQTLIAVAAQRRAITRRLADRDREVRATIPTQPRKN